MITPGQMRDLEDKSGISKVVLMEAAGKGLFEAMSKKYSLKGKKVLVVCYHGNNGGDGFVAAHYLSDIAEVDVLFLGNEEKLSDESRRNYERVLNNVMIQVFSDYAVDYDDYDFIVDAILGIGKNRPLIEPICEVIDFINSSKAIKVAVDIPTGFNPETGEPGEKMVNADLIVTFHDKKPGLEKFKDKVIVVGIGLKPQ